MSLFTGDKFLSTQIDMDILISLLDHGYDDLEEFDSAEFVLKPQPTDFSSHGD